VGHGHCAECATGEISPAILITNLGSGVGGDNTAPRGGGGAPPVWTSDGKSIIALVRQRRQSKPRCFDATTGKETDVASGNKPWLVTAHA